jgi:hypothetical protein
MYHLFIYQCSFIARSLLLFIHCLFIVCSSCEFVHHMVVHRSFIVSLSSTHHSFIVCSFISRKSFVQAQQLVFHWPLRGLLIPVDLVVSSQAATNQRCHGPGTLEFTARTQGRLLHDSL